MSSKSKATGSSKKSPAKAPEKSSAKPSESVPHQSAKAKRWYPAEDAVERRRTRKTVQPTKLRESLKPGSVLILLAGRFRGKRVILLKHLDQGVLLVTGPFKVNGVPLRRVNARYVIATSLKVDLEGLDSKTIDKVSEKGYFTEGKSKDKKGEEAFFKQGEKPQKKEISSTRAGDQKTVDKGLLSTIKKESHLFEYLQSSFSLRNGDRPHEMKW